MLYDGHNSQLSPITQANSRYQTGAPVKSSTFNTLQETFRLTVQFSYDRCSAASFWKGAAKLLFEDNFSLQLLWHDSSPNYSSLGPVCCVCKYRRSLFIKTGSEQLKTCGSMSKLRCFFPVCYRIHSYGYKVREKLYCKTQEP